MIRSLVNSQIQYPVSKENILSQPFFFTYFVFKLNIMIRHSGNIFLLILLSSLQCFSQGNTLKVIKTYSVGGNGGWDYISVSHGTRVNILDENSVDSFGVIPGTTGVDAIAFCNEPHTGYISNGRLNNIFAFDLTTNTILKQISTGENPNSISYEPFSKKIITCNGGGKSLSVIDPVNDTVIATIELNGKPEEAASDSKTINKK
jgi:YVTN family beta-propeller protein